jgi:hypothetical protein
MLNNDNLVIIPREMHNFGGNLASEQVILARNIVELQPNLIRPTDIGQQVLFSVPESRLSNNLHPLLQHPDTISYNQIYRRNPQNFYSGVIHSDLNHLNSEQIHSEQIQKQIYPNQQYKRTIYQLPTPGSELVQSLNQTKENNLRTTGNGFSTGVRNQFSMYRGNYPYIV